MRPADILRLVLLAALWGSSFCFVRVGAPVLGAGWFALLRAVTGSLLLLAWLHASGTKLDLRRHWRAYLLLGAVNTAFPWLLFSWSGRTLSASYMTLINATTPWFATMIGALWFAERLSLQKLGGLAVGFVGVGVLVTLGPVEPTPAVMLAAAAALLASIGYAAGAVIAKLLMKNTPYKTLAVGNVMASVVLLAPFAPLPPAVETWTPLALACAAGIGLFATGIAFPLYFRLVSDIGATRTNTAMFLVPVFGVLAGAVFLGEPLPPGLFAGAALALLATAMVLELFRRPRRSSA